MTQATYKSLTKRLTLISSISMLSYNVIFNVLEVTFFELFFSFLLVVLIPLTSSLYLVYKYFELKVQAKFDFILTLLVIVLILYYAYLRISRLI